MKTIALAALAVLALAGCGSGGTTRWDPAVIGTVTSARVKEGRPVLIVKTSGGPVRTTVSRDIYDLCHRKGSQFPSCYLKPSR